MSDDSDTGYFPGESYFEENKNIINNPNENINNDEENNEENDNNKYSNDNYNKNYNDYEEEQQEYENNSQNNNYNGEYYEEGYEYEEYEDSNYNNNYDSSYNYSDNYSNDYNNSYSYNHNRNRNYNNRGNNGNKGQKYKYNNFNRSFVPINIPVKRTSEYYDTSFARSFKIWLILVIKLLSDNKEKIDFYKKDEKINKEIIESLLNYFENYINNKNDNEKEGENKKNPLQINIENIQKKNIVHNDYNIEFDLIITDKLEIFFVEKYIKIKVKGEVNNGKYPVFYFQLKEYELTLTNENIGTIVQKKESEDSSDSKKKKENIEKKDNNDDKDDKSKNQNNEKKKNIIIKVEENEESNKNKIFHIGMCPNYSVKNKQFYELLMKIEQKYKKDENDEKDENKIIRKGPQEEIMELIFELTNLLKEEKRKKK